MAGCSQEWFDNLSAFYDGELTKSDQRRVEEHLEGCAPCRRVIAVFADMREGLASSSTVEVPRRVRERAEAVVYREALGKQRWATRGAVASALFAVAAAVFLILQPASSLADSLKDELVSHHWNGFTREVPYEFESKDPEAVSAWLEGRLGYPVSVSIPQGATLMGARLCRITSQRTAAVMYRAADKSALTVFVPPKSSRAATMARDFIGGEGVRCTNGPLGAAICIKKEREGQPMLAVAETQTSLLKDALASH